MMTFDGNAISIAPCAQRKQSFRLNSYFSYKSIRCYSEDDSPAHVKSIRSHGIKANFRNKTSHS